ncbi:MAG TPA: NAD(P)/FAD-dependent oxidoreductase [Sorangium sp.]|nr:NAD(P)/FAD-dependent oxidoreductase [Sorangium sp.]
MGKPLHVVVIGAGTGGMTLAHGLMQAGMSVAVYERDRTRTGGLHGYRVGINADGSRALAACLPPRLFETFVATCAKPLERVSFMTEGLKQLLTLDIPQNPDPTSSEKSVSRMTLRQVLFSGAEEIIHFDKVFTHYEQHPDGKVTAFFKDGSSATGDLLVGADGTRSRVRSQRLPHAKIRDAGAVAVGGKAPLTDEVRAILPSVMTEGSSFIFAPRGLFSVMHTMEFPWDAEGAPKTGVGSTEADLIRAWPGLLYDNTRDYFMWGVAWKADRVPARLLEMRGGELLPLVKELTPGWSPRVHRIHDLSDPESTFSINISTSEPIPPWKASNVTLLGDAIHTMTPGRGAGANTALRDANLLRKRLIDVRNGKLSLLEAVHRYEAKMVEYGFKAVAESLKDQGGDSPMYKPVIGSMMLAGMRTMLRVTSLFPPMKRRMAESLLRERGAEREED